MWRGQSRGESEGEWAAWPFENKPHKTKQISLSGGYRIFFFLFFLQNTSWIRKPQVISGGRGTHPLHPPPRSAPVLSLCLFFSLLFSRSLPSRRTPLSERLEQAIYTEETMGRTRDFYPPLSKAPWSLRLLRRRVNKKSEKRNVIRRQGFFGYDAMCNNGFAPFLL